MRLLILLLCLQSAALCAAPRVVTSIPPLHELTAAIMEGVGEPALIIKDHASAHHFAFKPSHMRSLQQADLVIWVGRRFEAGFNRVPEVLPPSAQQLELMPVLGIENDDGHFWYSPKLLLRSVEIILAALTKLDSENRTQYKVNAESLIKAIETWREDTQNQWLNRQPRFITDHAFTGHFEADMGFRAIATIHDQHDSHGGFKDLNRIESLLRTKPAACLLTMESPASPLAQSLAQKYKLQIVNVLTIAVTNSQSPLIVQRLDQLNIALRDCL
ncbi:MAG: metal ABC transporter substrate-binding protein [Gammaproteobacteria bacterium]|nr:metal ABC transporter substrate-binding protein [Gammaproteobacteria bacterium]